MYVVPKGLHETFDTIGQNSDEKKSEDTTILCWKSPNNPDKRTPEDILPHRRRPLWPFPAFNLHLQKFTLRYIVESAVLDMKMVS